MDPIPLKENSQFVCWCCGQMLSSKFSQKYGPRNEYTICGSCVGTLAVVDTRLTQITRTGKLGDELTANSKDVPDDEK